MKKNKIIRTSRNSKVDADFIRSAKGMIPKKKGDKPMTEWWSEYKAEERSIEERKLNLII